MEELGFLAQRLFNTPIAIHPRKGEIAVASLAKRLGITQMLRGDGSPVPAAWFDDDDDEEFSSPRSTRDPGYDMLGGVAVIPIAGTLVQKRSSLRPFSGMTGYNSIRQSFLTALHDDEVKSIAFDICSGGGEVAGCFDLVDTIFKARGEKPISAILTESAYSAAYAIASAVDPGRLYVPRTGGTGSIAVICMHADISEGLGKAGIKVTFITSEDADRKTDGRSEIPLSSDAYDAIKEEIDEMGVLFRETVARNRGISTDKVLGFKAGTFMGARGVTAGLADIVMAPDAAFAALISEVA